MKSYIYKIFFLIILAFFTTNIFSQAPTSAWINEFHYDDVGADSLEFIEIIVNQGFTDLSNFTVTLYNGNGGAVYDTKTLDLFVPGTTQDGFKLYYYDYTSNGASIQNGSPDGLCIDYNGVLISGQFLSYEGTFTAVGGPADGLMSIDIGVSEDGTTTPAFSSLGLTGSGTQYSDFTWTNFDAAATPGMPNGQQILPVELSSFSASVIDNNIVLNWTTQSEINNSGFEIERLQNYKIEELKNWERIGFVKGNGTTTESKSYSFIDKNIEAGKYSYRLKQIDFDGTYNYSTIVEVESGIPDEFTLFQNYPNPFNPTTKISWQSAIDSRLTLKVYDVLGNLVDILVDQYKDAGKHEIEWDAGNQPSGVYFFQLKANDFVETKKLVLLR